MPKKLKAGNCFWCDQALYHASREHPNRRWHVGDASRAICYECALKIAAFVLYSMQRERKGAMDLDEAREVIATLRQENEGLKTSLFITGGQTGRG